MWPIYNVQLGSGFEHRKAHTGSHGSQVCSVPDKLIANPQVLVVGTRGCLHQLRDVGVHFWQHPWVEGFFGER